MEPDDGRGDDEHRAPLLPPDDRLWRHSSEIAAYGPPPEATGDRTGRRRTWATAVAAAACGAVVGVGAVALAGAFEGRARPVTVVERVALPARTLSTTAGGPGPGAVRVAEGLRPAVVEVAAEGDGPARRGSGVMFRSDGHLLTNAHVVEDGARITVTLADGARAAARLVGADAASDLAVVKVDGWSSVVTAPLGSAAGLAVGQDVMAMGASAPGAPLALAVGMVSAVGRQVDRGTAAPLVDLIQTDTPVGERWSGGALADDRGAVVGILTSLSTPDAGVARMGFATPIDVARTVADHLVAGTPVARPWIGIEAGEVDPAAEARGGTGGAVVSSVRPGGPAQAAGLAAGDVITAVDAVPVASMGALRILVRSHRPGDVVHLTVVRGPSRRSVAVTLAERPPDP
ncbi:MAG: S1C family serine protease [Acidimicrobiia bacterium]